MMFSVIIPTYNRPQALRRCMAAFANLHSQSPPFELIVIDDGSDEDMAAYLADFMRQLPLRVVRQVNQGPAAARNYGARLANGRYLAFIDDDCCPTPDWLVQLGAAAQQQPTALLGGRTINALPHNLYAVASQQMIDYLYGYFVGRNGRFFTSNNMALRRDLFWQIGGFDETMPLAAGEDREMCVRWQGSGGVLHFVAVASVQHYHALTWRSFLRQHSNYGRGAWQYRQRQRAAHRLEPPHFYWGLVAAAWRERPLSLQTGQLAFLLLLSQFANAAGFWAARRG